MLRQAMSDLFDAVAPLFSTVVSLIWSAAISAMVWLPFVFLAYTVGRQQFTRKMLLSFIAIEIAAIGFYFLMDWLTQFMLYRYLMQTA